MIGILYLINEETKSYNIRVITMESFLLFNSHYAGIGLTPIFVPIFELGDEE